MAGVEGEQIQQQDISGTILNSTKNQDGTTTWRVGQFEDEHGYGKIIDVKFIPDGPIESVETKFNRVKRS